MIKYNRPIEGLDEEETVVIQMGRQILRDHHLDPAIHARALNLFGRQATLELAVAMGDYLLAGLMLIVADQQLPRETQPLLPTR